MTMGTSRFSLTVTAATVVFILLPLVVTVAISVSDTPFVTFPPRGFTLAWYGKVVTDPDFLASLQLSLGLAAGATFGAVLFGVPAALALQRCVFPGRGAAEGLLLSPLIFPVLITGLALLRLFSLWGSADAVVNLLIAHVLVTAPYVVRTVAASLALADRTLEEAARTLGANHWQVFRRITVPQIMPGLIAGALFAFLVSFDNYPISMWLADAPHFPLPMLIFSRVESIFEPSVAAMSTVMIVIAMGLVLILERVAGLRRAIAM